MPRYFKNGMIVSVSVTIFTILLSIFAGYGFSRFSFPGKRRLFIFILATQMFPAVLIIVQLYILFHNLKIINTYYGLILALTALSLPLSIWMLRGFFDRIPRELEEAAWVDGCSVMGALYRIIVPIISPGIIAVALFSFLVAWNNLLFTLTLSIRPEMYTIPPGFLSDYVGQFTYYWAEMSAGAVMVSIPVIIIFILLQKYLVQGLTAGAVKG
ncbi:MAG: carbohydrate ABC transporter permease [Actinobacteria bacterium]|nr:carbohydrate ABC transporter permease [Actinomycetota bacterium]